MTDAGSYMSARVKGLGRTRRLTFCAMIWPTLLAHDSQTIIAIEEAGAADGVRLMMGRGGRLTLEVRSGSRAMGLALGATPMLERQWYAVGFCYDTDTGEAELWQRPLKPYAKIRDTGEIAGKVLALAGLSATVALAGRALGSARRRLPF